jgi:hypothetical protein
MKTRLELRQRQPGTTWSTEALQRFMFEYWLPPNDLGSGYIQWSVDGKQSYEIVASAVGLDPEVQVLDRGCVPQHSKAILTLFNSKLAADCHVNAIIPRQALD